MDITNNLQNKEFDTTIPQHGGNIEQEAKELGYKRDQLLDASASIVPFYPPPILLNSLSQSLYSSAIRHYPDRSHSSLKESIASWHQIEPDMVLPGNGVAELITWSARNASTIGTSALLAPSFSDYERALQCWGAKFIYMPIELRWPNEQPQPFPIRADTQVVWITNPHNPTGQLWDINSLVPLLEKHKLVICDEAFLPLVPNGEQHSLVPFTPQYKNLIVLRSLTKLFAIAGLRLGYAISSKVRLNEWQKWRDPWPMNSLAITAGIMLMSNKELTHKWLHKIHRWIQNEGKWFHIQLGNLPGITAHSSSVNFQLIERNSSLTHLREKLANSKILLRDCRSFNNLNSNWLRISLQTRQNNQKIINTMSKILKESQ